MDGYNFTDDLRLVLQLARDEAARMHHEYVGTEHLLLALIRKPDVVSAGVFTMLGVDREEIRRRVEETVKPGRAASAFGGELPYTSRSKKVLEFAMREARELGHSYMGTEHLLLGLLREEMGIGAQTLAHFGVTIGRVVGALNTLGHTTTRTTAPADTSHGVTVAGAGRRLLLLALALAAILLLTGEFHWGSGALVLACALWIFRFLHEVVRLRRASAA